MEVYKYEYSNNYKNAELKRLYFEAEDITDESVEWYFDVSFDAEVESQREGFVFVDEPLPINDIDDECLDLDKFILAPLDKSLGKQCVEDNDCAAGQKCIQYQHGIQNRKCGKE